MAKFELDDGSTISSSHYMDNLFRNDELQYMIEGERNIVAQRPSIVKPMKIPPGLYNRHRILNTSTYDLFVHIQESLATNNRCIIDLITNNSHKCPNTTDTIQRRIHQYAEQFIDDAFIDSNPRNKVQCKVDGTDNQFTYRWETDEEWHDRLCHLMMHRNHPQKLQMIKCEECLQEWLNSSKW